MRSSTVWRRWPPPNVATFARTWRGGAWREIIHRLATVATLLTVATPERAAAWPETNRMPLSVATLAELARYDTPTICNVIELFGVVPRNRGYLNARVKSNFPEMGPMVGYAATACFRADEPGGTGDSYGSIERQLAEFERLPGPAAVVFQDLDDPPVAAVFGEVMCSTYKAFGARGLVTNGAGRDLEQVRALGFPVFTGSTICSHGYCHILHVGLPVRVGGTMIHQGDLLHGDANGVALIPETIASEVAAVAAEFVAAERLMLDYVQSPEPAVKSVAEFTARRQQFAAAVARLEQRVKAGSPDR